jgi:hypothetical protein
VLLTDGRWAVLKQYPFWDVPELPTRGAGYSLKPERSKLIVGNAIGSAFYLVEQLARYGRDVVPVVEHRIAGESLAINIEGEWCQPISRSGEDDALFWPVTRVEALQRLTLGVMYRPREGMDVLLFMLGGRVLGAVMAMDSRRYTYTFRGAGITTQRRAAPELKSQHSRLIMD